MVRHHANNILLVIKPSFNDIIAQLGASSNNKTLGQFEYDVVLLCFCLISLIYMDGDSIFCLRFQVMQIKQVNCKMSIKKKFFLKKSFGDIFGQLHTQECKSAKKQIVRLQLNLDPSASVRYKRKTKIFLNCSGDEIGFS